MTVINFVFLSTELHTLNIYQTHIMELIFWKEMLVPQK